MAVIELTKDNFEQVVGDNPMVMIDFWASWCGPCRMFAPIFEEASEKHTDVVFAKVNTEKEQELAAYFQVRSIPTLMMAKEQVFVFQESGALPASAVDEVIGQVRDLDMDKVRKEIAEKQDQA